MDKRSFVFVLILSISLFLFNMWIAPPLGAPPVVQVQELEQNPQERLYVLENETQQIVFSNIGGAIKEINLPFQSTTATQSIVRPIEFDRQIEKESPQNFVFPLSTATYFDSSSDTIEPYKSKNGGYTPLLRRSVKGNNGNFTFLIQPKFYMAQLLNDEGEYEGGTFQMTKLTKDSIQFSGSLYGQKITKTYELVAPYGYKLTINFGNAQNRTLFLTNGVSEVELISGAYEPNIQTLQIKGDKLLTEKVDLPKKELGMYNSINPMWISSSNGFFGTILSPEMNTAQAGFNVRKIEGENCPTRLHLIDQKYDLYPVRSYPAYQVSKQLVPQNGAYSFRFYAGPFVEKTLIEASNVYAQNPEFGLAQTVQGWFSFISEPIARLMFFVMKICYKFTNSWGVSILAVTIALRLLTFPLNQWSTKSMLAQAQLKPEIDAIQARHKKDPKKMQMETWKLYQERKINPFSGCVVPFLIQIPILIGVMDLFRANFDLRGVPFLFPSWIPNLAAPDILFSWGYPLPYIGNEFHILPLIAGLITFLHLKLTTTQPKQEMNEKQPQMASPPLFMAILTSVLFYRYAAGVSIYFAFSSFLGVLQHFLMMKKTQKSNIQILKK
ncbi:MAG: membrane protein insertase YidC [Chlamydiae bacterium]|nr:membrane protein insertase YidC [Chlamydiota bacterium]